MSRRKRLDQAGWAALVVACALFIAAVWAAPPSVQLAQRFLATGGVFALLAIVFAVAKSA